MSATAPTMLAAFAGGLLTAASPCVIAALPVAVGYVGGRATSVRQGWTLSAAMVVGMTLALTLLGLAAARLGMLMGALPGPYTVAAGLLIVALGVGIGWGGRLDRCGVALPTALQRRLAGSGVAGALLLGALLGTVMTPCATPALAAALAIAGSSGAHEGAAWQGAALLAAYGLGHSALLLLAGASPVLAQTMMRRADAVVAWLPGRRAFATMMMMAGLWLAGSTWMSA